MALSADLERACREAARIIGRARAAVAFTGAGISVPSGIPDFRSQGGLWTRYDPMRVATAQALRENPGEVWDFLLAAEEVLGPARPNPAHRALAEMEAAGAVAAVITQNIDGLHQAAGSVNVVEFHGSAARYYCASCRAEADRDEIMSRARTGGPPACVHCGGAVRPDIVFFGEPIPERAMAEANRLAARADVALIAGTSGEVAPANVWPWRVKRAGGAVVEINLGRTAYEGLPDVRLDAPVEEVLPFIAGILET